MTLPVNIDDLRTKVQDVYVKVATQPEGEYHFEMGLPLAERLGYAPADLERIPAEAISSFAGVGHHFDLAGLRPGERVVDLGSGSGMDSFLAALAVGDGGEVVGVDMTDAQLHKASALRDRLGLVNLDFRKGFIEELPLGNDSAEVVISNGVINLCADKAAVFREVARILAPGGRLAISDIVTERPLTEAITCNASLWAACIGGAAQEDDYRATIEAADLEVVTVRQNPQYAFLTTSAQGASREFGVKSISLLARKR